MSGRIPDAFIDDLLARTDIVDVVGARVTLKRGGSNYLGLCPFHTEKTPSFTVSPSKQFYHCFGCGAHGTAIRFLMEFDRMEFREAVESLARGAGMEIPAEARDDAAPDHSGLYATLAEAERLYQEWLRRHPQRGRAVDYLKRRGVSGSVAAEYGLGFAPPGWDNLTHRLGRPETLLEAGLASRRDGRVYDRFRDRIMFPIRDRRGRVLGFGARILDQGEPKYLNSPDTPVFHKGHEIYGLFEALARQRQPDRLLVVEGYMDVLALTQAGVEGAVATLGTATTTRQVERLFRTVRDVTFCFDGDEAGRSAAWRALENTLPALREGRQARILFLPEGEDPDTLVRREGVEAFRRRLEAESRPVAEVLVERLTAGVEMGSLDGRARLIEEALPLLQKLPPEALRRLLVERLAGLAQVDADYLEARVEGRETAAEARGSGARRPQGPAGPGRAMLERSTMRLAIGLLLHRPSLAGMVSERDWITDLDARGADLLAAMLEIAAANPHVSTAAMVQRFQGSEHERSVAKLAAWEPAGSEAGQEKEFAACIAKLQALMKQQRLQYLHQRIEQGKASRDEVAEFNRLTRQ